MFKKILFLSLAVSSLIFGQQYMVIGDGMIGDELLTYVVDNYKTSTTLGYGPARDIMYGEIDVHDGNQLSGVYSGFTIELDMVTDPSVDAYNKGINCEHTWPQSLGAGSEPQRSDMHHLFPTRVEANSARGNDPFLDIPDANTVTWYRLDQTSSSIPTDYIDEWSEDTPSAFEVREDHKGNTARAMIYFYAMYQDAADDGFWSQQNTSLLAWHYLDPVDSVEYERTYEIAAYQQDNPNPFVLDSSLARRIWWPNASDTSTTHNSFSSSLPDQLVLYNAFPNPFNPTTTISYELPLKSHVLVTIYDLCGNEVKTLINKQEYSGVKSTVWDATNNADQPVSAGVYLYQVQIGNFTQTKKMVLLK
ncbi:MAG: endonuclease [Candidatus Marinimicrobia bacterium]|nr:endonuclease [Candidatus Neomarinimicrobiota bacterium]